MSSSINPMWGGRFDVPSSELLLNINQSISFDIRLAAYDILGSKAHCQMLATQGILSETEAQKIIGGLEIIEQKINAGEFKGDIHLEDVHMNIESELFKLIGETAGKLHTARSRNDQVVTAFKLWMRDALKECDQHLMLLQSACIFQAKQHIDTILPGFTHLQAAQPISFAHHMLAYFEMFKRDRLRIQDALNRLNECPLGAAALAGTSYPIDRFITAKLLGFQNPTRNSLDSVSDRDFVMDYLSLSAICAVHLSRLAEEVINWSSQQFNFVTLSDAFTTGSSIMPQKKNPDPAELIRGKTGRIIGNLNALLIIMKGLTLGYSKDMQEDKEAAFDTHDTLNLSIRVMVDIIKTMKVNKQSMYNATTSGYLTATDLADRLVQSLGFPFRKAHAITGKIVKTAESKHCKLEELSLAEMQDIEHQITQDIYDVLKIENSVARKTSFGGTAFKNVKQAIKKAEASL